MPVRLHGDDGIGLTQAPMVGDGTLATLRNVIGPALHQFSPPVEQVAAQVCDLEEAGNRCARASLQTSQGTSVHGYRRSLVPRGGCNTDISKRDPNRIPQQVHTQTGMSMQRKPIQPLNWFSCKFRCNPFKI